MFARRKLYLKSVECIMAVDLRRVDFFELFAPIDSISLLRITRFDIIISIAPHHKIVIICVARHKLGTTNAVSKNRISCFEQSERYWSYFTRTNAFTMVDRKTSKNEKYSLSVLFRLCTIGYTYLPNPVTIRCLSIISLRQPTLTVAGVFHRLTHNHAVCSKRNTHTTRAQRNVLNRVRRIIDDVRP